MSMKIQLLDMDISPEPLLNVCLMRPLCQIFMEKAYSESGAQTSQRNICHGGWSTLVRNSIINIHLPLMILIRMHSQESQFHNKCLFCLIMSIIYVQISYFVRAFGKPIQKRVQVQPNVGRKVQKVPLQPVETC